ncbi:LysR substrate-binding domain-containing protein [Janthinobacterium agaricidamnosum]|uniref:Bacterial regulatory helix-turn-helix, lysR family protein n=1 Tax=Janthinobacterium agaricidamnosum NBRC 102515 = DSM 9628 TaxID=1349767 RepID=W0VEF8_9BURK|nr:LysR substrate-binding domain-containing protein [Janthinobacterium agaricidamnosum]CDG85798.1 bacterial regulatory helix-turn-helix, lysR family protein [Janthinobacterium agaricidamnosum NBRC 102515 = DSM 9628]
MRNVNLDIALLRTFVLTHQLGSMARTADVVGRSQSAVSQQMSRLEEIFGQQLFLRQGRLTSLTEAGIAALPFAEEMLRLNDELVRVAAKSDDGKEIRLGMALDFSVGMLNALLREFQQKNPAVRLSMLTDRHTVLSEKLANGALDLALMFSENEPQGAHSLGRVQQVWVGQRSVLERPRPLQLVVFEEQCGFRTRALLALAEAGIAAHIAVTCSSLAALWVAVESGYGIALRTAIGVPKPLLLDASDSLLPLLPQVHLCLHQTPHGLHTPAHQLRRRIMDGLPQLLPALAADVSRPLDALPDHAA